jgi:hypothetical protein
LKNLQSLYVYGTGVQQEDMARLKKVLPKTAIETGGYSIPILESDTTKVKAAEKK